MVLNINIIWVEAQKHKANFDLPPLSLLGVLQNRCDCLLSVSTLCNLEMKFILCLLKSREYKKLSAMFRLQKLSFNPPKNDTGIVSSFYIPQTSLSHSCQEPTDNHFVQLKSITTNKRHNNDTSFK